MSVSLPGILSATMLINHVASRHGVKPADITGPRRHAHLVLARAEVAVGMRECGWTYRRIGEALGGRHHTSAMYLAGKGASS